MSFLNPFPLFYFSWLQSHSIVLYTIYRILDNPYRYAYNDILCIGNDIQVYYA